MIVKIFKYLLSNVLLKFIGLILLGIIVLFFIHNYKVFIAIVIGVLILFFIDIISQRKKKKAFYPIENIDMNKEQMEYVLKELSKASKVFMPKVDFRALEYRNKIIYHQLRNEDIEGLNECLSRLGLYLFGFKIY